MSCAGSLQLHSSDRSGDSLKARCGLDRTAAFKYQELATDSWKSSPEDASMVRQHRKIPMIVMSIDQVQLVRPVDKQPALRWGLLPCVRL